MKQIVNDVWIVDGPSMRYSGLIFGTRMTIIKLEDHLWIHSPVSVSDDLAGRISELGRVRYVIAPNKSHHTFLAEWQQRHENALFYAAPGLSAKRPDIRFDEQLAENARFEWSGDIAHEVFGENRLSNEVVFFHHITRTLILTDLIVNIRTDGFNWLQKAIAKFEDVSYPNGSTPRLYRWAMKSKKPAKRVLKKMLEWEPDRVIISHGEWFRENGRAELEARLSWIN